MNFYVNFQLVLATAGTLFSLFLMILIVGYRRRRIFERVLFFLALALFFYYSGILLFLNASQFYSSEIPRSVARIADWLVLVGMFSLPALLVHAHFAYGRAQMEMLWRWWQTTITIFAYIPVVGRGALLLQNGSSFEHASVFSQPQGLDAFPNVPWLAASILVCVSLQIVFASRSRTSVQRVLHRFLAVYFSAVGALAIRVFIVQNEVSDRGTDWTYPVTGGLDYWMLVAVIFAWVLPLVLIVYAIVRYQALGVGSQKNLVYSVSIAFLAVLYLSVVRRVC